MWTVYGYEKDSDIYDKIGTYTFGVAKIVARDLCSMDAKCKETEQPYDWFELKGHNGRKEKYVVYKNCRNEIICEEF